MKKRMIATLLSLILLLSLVAACGNKEPETSTDSNATTEVEEENDDNAEAQETQELKKGLKIAYSVGYTGNAWRSQLVASLQAAADEYIADGTIADFQIVDAGNDSTTQISQCNALLAEGLDALLICAVSPTTMSSVVEQGLSMGTNVILSNDPAVYEGTYCVVNDAYRYSMLINRWAATKLPEGSDVVYISGNPGNGTDMIRDQAVYDAIKEYGWNLLGEAAGKRNQTEAQNVMSTFLSTYDKIDGVICQNVTFEGVKAAYDNAGKEMPVVCGDSVLSTVRMWGTIDDFETIGVTNSPAVSVASLHFAVLQLQGYTLKEEVLQPCPADGGENLINTVLLDPPVAITLDGKLPDDIMADYPNLTVYSRDDALEKFKDEEDTYSPDMALTREQCIELWFNPPQ
jgi:ribose transport system substrate-binding protein